MDSVELGVVIVLIIGLKLGSIDTTGVRRSTGQFRI